VGDLLPLSDGPTILPGQLFEAVPDYENPVTGGRLQWRAQAKRIRTYVTQGGQRYPGTMEYRFQVTDIGTGLRVSDFKLFLAPGVGLVAAKGRHVATSLNIELVETRWPWDPTQDPQP
jgi:hypothetical protein